MAAVTYTNGTEFVIYSGEFKIVVWKSPSTMDSNDTVVLPTPPSGKYAFMVPTGGITGGAWDATSGDSVTCTQSTLTCTVDATGGTTDHVYFITYIVA